MKRNTIYTLAIATAFLISAVSPSLALAQAQAGTPAPLTHPEVGNPENKCDILQHKIGNRLSHYKTARANHIEKYNRIVERSIHMINVLKQKGFDPLLVANLEEDLKTLKSMIQNFGTHAEDAIKMLESANDYNCGESEGEFMGRFNEAREQLKAAHGGAQEIKNFINTEVKADIEALKNSRPTPSPSLSN